MICESKPPAVEMMLKIMRMVLEGGILKGMYSEERVQFRVQQHRFILFCNLVTLCDFFLDVLHAKALFAYAS